MMVEYTIVETGAAQIIFPVIVDENNNPVDGYPTGKIAGSY